MSPGARISSWRLRAFRTFIPTGRKFGTEAEFSTKTLVGYWKFSENKFSKLLSTGVENSAKRRARDRKRYSPALLTGRRSRKGVLSKGVAYDITIWEEIRSAVRGKRDGLLETINTEITKDLSLAEFQGKQPVSWQLRQIMEQRANSWVQKLYEFCCEVRKGTGKEVSADFDRAIWAYCIEPFIVGEQRIGFDYKMSLLDLLFCAVGSPPDKRESRKVSQVECCLDVRWEVSEKWYYQLHHLPSRMEESAAAMARFNAREAAAKRIVAGWPPEPTPAPRPGPPVVAPAGVPSTAKAHRT